MFNSNRIRTLIGAVALTAATAIITTQVVSQQTSQSPPGDVDAQHQQWLKYSTPSEHHKKLDAFIGDWEQTIRLWWYPGAEPQQSRSTASYQWIMDGRFVKGAYTGDIEGQPFRGMDLLGYDNFRQQYISLWIDNMTTSFMTATGNFSRSGNELRMSGATDDVISGEKDKPFRTVTRFVDDNTLVYEIHTPGPDGEFFKSLEVKSVRK